MSKPESIENSIAITDYHDDSSNDDNNNIILPYWKALLRTLVYANVQFVRFYTLDLFGNIRCKVIPIDQLIRNTVNTKKKQATRVALVKVCIAGLPSYGDVMQTTSGLTAAGTVYLYPDINTIQVLPYATNSALVFGNLYEEKDNNNNNNNKKSMIISDVCTRSLLQNIITNAKKKYNISFNIGIEIEFCLYDRKTNQPIDYTNFADTTLLNQQEEYISELYKQLNTLNIPIELIHSESAYGQMEIVLQYIDNDPVMMIDNVILTKETISTIAYKYNLKAIFLPKINPMQAGNGCHIHISINNNNNEMASDNIDNDNNSNLTRTMQSFIEGILQELSSLMAITMPTTNSFRRVGPGCWTGSKAVWEIDDKEAPIRVLGERFEYKLCDNMSNLYLALSTILIAGLNGIEQQFTLRPSLSKMTIKEQEEQQSSINLPSTITDSLNKLENNILFQNTIPKQMMKGYIAVRRAEVEHASNMTLQQEVDEMLQKA